MKGRSGRPSTTSQEELARTAMGLFETRGYTATSVTDIANAASIGRRTFFAYFTSKADAFWWADEQDLRSVETALANSPHGDIHPLQQVIDASKRSPSWQHPTKEGTRSRYLMIEENPELQIGSHRFQRRWSQLIAHHIRERISPTDLDLLPEVIASALIGVAEAVLVRWVSSDDERTLQELFDDNVSIVRHIFEQTVADKLLQ